MGDLPIVVGFLAVRYRLGNPYQLCLDSWLSGQDYALSHKKVVSRESAMHDDPQRGPVGASGHARACNVHGTRCLMLGACSLSAPHFVGPYIYICMYPSILTILMK